MKIIPSILTGSYEELHQQVILISSVVDWIQIDVADGKFVDNKTIGLEGIPDNEFKGLATEVHLMVKDPSEYLEDCQRLNVNRVIFHIEAVINPDRIIKDIIATGRQAGLAFSPQTKIDLIEKYIDDLNSVLLLSVEPGRQGQKFIPDVLLKIPQMRTIDPDIIIGLDGGVNLNNLEKINNYHPDYVSIGSALWQSPDPLQVLEKLKNIV